MAIIIFNAEDNYNDSAANDNGLIWFNQRKPKTDVNFDFKMYLI